MGFTSVIVFQQLKELFSVLTNLVYRHASAVLPRQPPVAGRPSEAVRV
jgi:hypothetical protein